MRKLFRINFILYCCNRYLRSIDLMSGVLFVIVAFNRTNRPLESLDFDKLPRNSNRILNWSTGSAAIFSNYPHMLFDQNITSTFHRVSALLTGFRIYWLYPLQRFKSLPPKGCPLYDTKPQLIVQPQSHLCH